MLLHNTSPLRIGRGLILALAFAGVVLFTATSTQADDKKHDGHDHKAEKAKGKKAPAHDDHGEHKEPSAMDHVLDSPEFHLFDTIEPKHWGLKPILGFQITKFMLLEVLAALLIVAIYIPLSRRLASGDPPHGAWDNFFETLLTFVRNEIAIPSLTPEHHDDHHDHDHHDDHGHDNQDDPHHAHEKAEQHHKTEVSRAHGHEHIVEGQPADKYVPFLWTIFLFVLFNNLLGMVPFLGSATASIWVTLGLAGVVFFAIHGSAVKKMGFFGYLGTLWPQIDVPGVLRFPIRLLVCVIEVVGILVKNVVLAVRLFANMFAGHMVLATILFFIKMASSTHVALWSTITLSSVLGIVALSLLELFVAFLQAYIFTFLTALFMGMAINPQH